MPTRRVFIKVATLCLALELCFCRVLLASEPKTLPTPETTTTAPASTGAKKHIPIEDIQRFSNALGQIKQYYVKPVRDDELFDNAIRGMLSGLDPHSSYLDEESFKDLQLSTSGEFAGLGIEVTMEEGVIKVVTPLVDTPAFKAGIKPGDYIVKLGSQAVQGLTLRKAVDLMRGREGTKLNLTILRKGANKPMPFSVMREKITMQSVKSKMLDKGFGYVRLLQFQAMTGDDMTKAIAQLKQQDQGKLKGLVLDLRNNPGGLLETAIQVADSFLDSRKHKKPETIVYTRGRLPGSEFSAVSNAGDILDNAPLIVLINNGSASASEIVAGALKDNKRAIILGTQSFGKGSVQTVLPLDEKRAIKLTTALYYTPSGTSIQATGITPDIIVDEINIPPNKNQTGLTYFSEASLSGHLANGTQSAIGTPKAVDSIQNLLYEDYQLYSALNVLKGLAAGH